MTTIRTAIQQAERELRDTSDSPRLDAELLLAHSLGETRTYLMTWPDQALDEQQLAGFRSLLARRQAGEPIAYITGEREFWSLPLSVSPEVLIPRADTELLVELALERIPKDGELHIADLGTGSGAIALAIARERPRCHVVASDIAATALAVARFNAMQLGLSNIEYRLGSWLEALDEEMFDMILSNPPYIAENDPHLARGDVRYEPRHALSSGRDGLKDLRIIAKGARRHLREGGWLLVEHGYDQGEAVQRLMKKAGYSAVACHADLAGNDRVTVGCAA